ncbi:MAG: GAF domain-containing protein [Spirochaetales bacterium]|nr:GAF domain-containing protein [Spirochaetales bacterium]
MRFLRDISISIKVLIPAGVLILALGLVSGYAVFRLHDQRMVLTKIHDIVLKKITLIDEFILISEQVQSDVYQICVLKFMNVHEQEIHVLHQRLEQGLNDINVTYGEILTTWDLDKSEKQLLAKIYDPMNLYRHQAEQAAMSVVDNPSFGIFLVRSSIQPFTEFQNALIEFLDYQKLMIIQAENKAREDAGMVSRIIIVFSLFVMLSGIIAILFISTRLISGPILNLAKLMHKLAEGDLAVAVSGLERQDELGSMVRALAVFKDNSLDKARLDKALKQYLRNLESINRANNAFSSTLDPEEVLGLVMKEVHLMFSAPSVSIWFIDPETKELICSRAAGSSPGIIQGLRLSPGQGIIGWVAKSNESRLVKDIYKDEHFNASMISEDIRNIRSLLLVPLRVKEQAIGVLVAGDSNINRFSRTDLTLMESLAATASITIENARLYKQARQDSETRNVLLQEVNHRVKNNLAAIIGLLYTEKRYNKKTNKCEYSRFLDDLIQRIGGLASVHKLLSDTRWEPLSLKTLLNHIIQSSLKMHTPGGNIELKIDVSDILITPNQAHNLSIVINELVTNIIKHGIDENKEPRIIVSATLENNTVKLTFCDNGPGFPENVLNLEEHNMGFDLIKNIVKKNLRGELMLSNTPGALVEIRFKINATEE